MTKPELFIIESLGRDDEKDDLLEGGHISKMLSLSGSESHYVYIRTTRELEMAIKEFKRSDCRYLHISCHGNQTGIGLTLDGLTFEELGDMLRPVLKGRRVFFSSCSVMNKRCAKSLLQTSGCFSVIGPSTDIYFDRAAAFWCAFYHLCLRDDAKSIKHEQLVASVSGLARLFGVDMRYYQTSKKEAEGFRLVNLDTEGVSA